MRKLYLGILLSIFNLNGWAKHKVAIEPKLVKLTQNYKVGYKNIQGEVIVPSIYDAGSEFENYQLSLKRCRYDEN